MLGVVEDAFAVESSDRDRFGVLTKANSGNKAAVYVGFGHFVPQSDFLLGNVP